MNDSTSPKPAKRTHGKPIPPLSPADIERFHSKISKTPTEIGCLLWMAGKFSNGYGAFSVNHSRLLKAHRVACFLAHGQIPPGWEACHKCDTPLCCNPDHLFIGTDKDNTQDMLRKGRANCGRGEKSGQAKLTEAAVRDIRARYIPRKNVSTLAQKYGVSKALIGSVIRREVWRHVE